MSNADNLLRGGTSSVETLGKTLGANILPDGTNLAVRVQADRSDEFDSWTVRTGASPVLVTEADSFRTRCIVRNLGANTVVLGKLGKVTSGAGYKLPSGAELEIITTGEIQAVSEGVSELSVWVERDDE